MYLYFYGKSAGTIFTDNEQGPQARTYYNNLQVYK